MALIKLDVKSLRAINFQWLTNIKYPNQISIKIYSVSRPSNESSLMIHKPWCIHYLEQKSASYFEFEYLPVRLKKPSHFRQKARKSNFHLPNELFQNFFGFETVRLDQPLLDFRTVNFWMTHW